MSTGNAPFIYEKTIEATVDISNPTNFCTNTEEHLLGALRDKYNGKCFFAVYILNVKSIERRSMCKLVKTNNSGGGYMDVRFLADVVVFSAWDIITDVLIVNRQQMVLGEYYLPGGPKMAVVALYASKSVEAIAVGQKVPVRVMIAQHSPGQPQASIVATLLTCDLVARVYQLEGALSGDDARLKLAPLLTKIEKELAVRAQLAADHGELLWFFEGLLYAYRGEPAGVLPTKFTEPGPASVGSSIEAPWVGPPMLEPTEAGVEVLNLLDIVRGVVASGVSLPVAGLWSRPLNVHRSSPLVARLPGGAGRPDTPWAHPVYGDPCIVFAEMLKNILDFLKATHNLVKSYNSREDIEKHVNVWSIMRAAQRPVTAPR